MKQSFEEDSIADSVKRRRQVSPNKCDKVPKFSPIKVKDKIYLKNKELFGCSDEDSDDGGAVSNKNIEICKSKSPVVTSSDSPDIRYPSSKARDGISTRKNKLFEKNSIVKSSSEKLPVNGTVKKPKTSKLKSKSVANLKSKKVIKDMSPSCQVKITDSVSSGIYEFNSARRNVKKMEARINGMMTDQTNFSDDELPDLNCDINFINLNYDSQSSDITKSNGTNSLENISSNGISQGGFTKTSKKLNDKKNTKDKKIEPVKKGLGSNTKIDKIPKKRGRKPGTKGTDSDKQSTINTWITKTKIAKADLADDDFTPPSTKSKASPETSKSKSVQKKNKPKSPENNDLKTPEKSTEEFDEQNYSQDFNYSLDSYGMRVPKTKPLDNETILINDSINFEEEKPDPMWEYILKQREIEENLPKYLEKEYVCEIMKKLREDYELQETIIDFLKTKLDWLREVLSGKSECMWDKTYKRSARAGESMNYCQYYGVLSLEQINIITRYLDTIFEEDLKRIFAKDSRPYHRYIWQVQVPLVATLMCEQITKMNWEKTTEIILRARSAGATVSSFSIADFLKSD